MNYNLNKSSDGLKNKTSNLEAAKTIWPFIRTERKIILIALVAIIINAGMNLLAPRLIAHVVDTFIPSKDYQSLLMYAGIILVMYLLSLVASYAQTRLMGSAGQRMIFRLRNAIFGKLQELPVAFFNQNKAGDLISRINNDTENINQFFSQSLVQFMGSIFLMFGAAIFLLSINLELGAASLTPAVLLIIFTQVLSPWVKKKNLKSMQSLGGLSSEIQESLNNFKVIIAFNRRDYFKKRFQEVNEDNYHASVKAGIANNIFAPVYGLAASVGQLIVLGFGLYLISTGQFTIGLLISFLVYINNFYNPLRQLAALWASFQASLASWDRVNEILALETDLTLWPASESIRAEAPLLEFKHVNFKYPDGNEILHNINLELERGKTYALVGPTGGGKTTTASLMARLYDPTSGEVSLLGRDIRSYESKARTKKIGFILQEPFLFSGTIRDNIVYGNETYADFSNEELEAVIKQAGLESLLSRFDQGLETKVAASGETISLGQKQLIAFIRAFLRQPELLILDEATANIDTVTESLLEEILKKLPASTTKVIIAHRLNTIASADEIFFVNAGQVIKAGSMEHAVEMLLHGKRGS